MELKRSHKDFQLKNHQHLSKHLLSSKRIADLRHSTADCVGDAKNTHVDLVNKLQKEADKEGRYKHLQFLKRIQENGKDIVISEAHKKKLKVVDFIGNAMKQDIKENEDHAHGAAGGDDFDHFCEDDSHVSRKH